MSICLFNNSLTAPCRHYFFILLAALNLVTGSIKTQAEENVLNWYKLDFPPYTIKSGAYQNQGLGDRIQSFVAQKLNQFQHRTHFVTASQLYHELTEQKPLCTVNSDYDVEESFGHNISLPTNIYYNYNLISRADDKLTSRGPVSLEALLKRSSQRFILDAGRPYQHLDPLLEKLKQTSNLPTRSGLSLSGDILMAIDDGYSDYTLELCSTVRYLSATQSFKHHLVCAEIIENPSPFGRAAITCTANRWGDQIMPLINDVLQRHRGRKEYMEMMQQWYVPSNREKRIKYWQYYRLELLSVVN